MVFSEYSIIRVFGNKDTVEVDSEVPCWRYGRRLESSRRRRRLFSAMFIMCSLINQENSALTQPILCEAWVFERKWQCMP